MSGTVQDQLRENPNKNSLFSSSWIPKEVDEREKPNMYRKISVIVIRHGFAFS